MHLTNWIGTYHLVLQSVPGPGTQGRCGNSNCPRKGVPNVLHRRSKELGAGTPCLFSNSQQTGHVVKRAPQPTCTIMAATLPLKGNQQAGQSRQYGEPCSHLDWHQFTHNCNATTIGLHDKSAVMLLLATENRL